MEKDHENGSAKHSFNDFDEWSKEATLIIQKATERYQSSKRGQVPG